MDVAGAAPDTAEVPMIRIRCTGARFLPLAAGLLLLPVPLAAQPALSPALWDENVSLSAGGEDVSFAGSDPFVPEPASEELSGDGYYLAGNVFFGPPGPPEGAAAITWDVPAGGPSVQMATSVSIDFQLAVVQTAAPPGGVTEVPVRVAATGSATATGGVGPVAASIFRFQAVGIEILITRRVDADDNPDTSIPVSDSFDLDETVEIPVDMVVLVSMSAFASGTMVDQGAARQGSALGFIDPVVEVADETVPGSSSSYREFFTIEFSEGYDAQSTPVERTTVGDLKRRFGADR
jgi:hypothetical protein